MSKINLRELLADFEPARARAVVVAVIGVATSVGYGGFAEGLEPVAVAVIALIAALSALVTGEAARRKAFSPATVEKLLDDQAAYIADDPDPEIGGDVATATDEEADAMGLDFENSDLDEDVDDALPDVSMAPGEHRRED